MKITDTAVGAGFVLAGALTIAATLGYPLAPGGRVGPALFPRVAAGLMMALGALLALRGFRAKDVSEEVGWRELHRNPAFLNALFVLAGVLAYIVFVERLGFLLMGTLIMFVLMWRLRVRPVKALLVAVLFTAGAHFLFAKVLRVPLALGILWW